MNAAADPTLNIVKLLADKKRWHIVPGVPIFCPHTVRDKELGTVTVDGARLRRIVEVVKRRWERKRICPRITIGHIRKNVPETQQPPLVGWSHPDFWRIGALDGQPCIFHDEYYRRSAVPDVFLPDGDERYPFRSVEFFPPRDEITGIALLISDPELDLSINANRRGKVLCYGRLDMADDRNDDDPTKPPTTKEPPEKDGKDDTTGGEGEEKNEHPMLKFARENEHQLRYLCHSLAGDEGFKKYMADQAMGTGAPAMPGPTNGDIPGGSPDEERRKEMDKENFSRRQDQVRYERMQAELDQLKRDRDAERKTYNRNSAKRVMEHLIAVEKIEFPDDETRAEDYEAMAAMATDEEREKYARRICKTYKRDITAPLPPPLPTRDSWLGIGTLDGKVPPGADRDQEDPSNLSDARYEQAVEYCRKHGTEDWREAVEKTRPQKAGAN
jgi:hypothetical protein